MPPAKSGSPASARVLATCWRCSPRNHDRRESWSHSLHSTEAPSRNFSFCLTRLNAGHHAVISVPPSQLFPAPSRAVHPDASRPGSPSWYTEARKQAAAASRSLPSQTVLHQRPLSQLRRCTAEEGRPILRHNVVPDGQTRGPSPSLRWSPRLASPFLASGWHYPSWDRILDMIMEISYLLHARSAASM